MQFTFIRMIMKNINDNQKIVSLPTAEEREKIRQEKELALAKMNFKDGGNKPAPIFNLPPLTKYLLGLIVGIYFLTDVVLSADSVEWIFSHFGFIPEQIRNNPVDAFSLASPITHMFLHGSWMHVIMNAFMLAAFGSGVERWLGFKRTLVVFVISGLCGAALHYVLNTGSPYPMIGASGGISGLFAAAIVMMNKSGQEMGGKVGILPFALLWIGLSIGFGMLGGPDGSLIAWAAHVGGFLGGFIALKLMRV